MGIPPRTALEQWEAMQFILNSRNHRFQRGVLGWLLPLHKQKEA